MNAAKFRTIADSINRDGRAFADKAIERGAGSPHIALGILGVAVGQVIDRIDEKHRAEMLRKFLDNFGTEDTA